MRKIMAMAMVVVLSAAVVACSSSDTANPETTNGTTNGTTNDTTDVAIATQTQNEFFAAISAGDTAALDAVLSEAFQLVRADGSHATKDEYLANPASIDDFSLSDFDVTRTGDTIVARFTGSVTETIDGQVYDRDPAPRFAVMVRNGDRWQIVAQVNLSTPAPQD